MYFKLCCTFLFPSVYFYNIRKRGEGEVGHFLTFSNKGEGGGGWWVVQNWHFFSNVIKVQPLTSKCVIDCCVNCLAPYMWFYSNIGIS